MSVFESFAAFSESLGADPSLIAQLLREDPESSRLLVNNESGRIDDAGVDRASLSACASTASRTGR